MPRSAPQAPSSALRLTLYYAIAQRRIAEAQLQPSLLPNHGFHLTAAQVGLWDAEDESGAAAGEP